MDPFIRSADLHFVLRQARNVMNSHLSVRDGGVLDAVEGLAEERSKARLGDIPEEALAVVKKIGDVRDQDGFARFREELLPFVIPFPAVTEHQLKKTFPKVKKLKVPALEDIEWRDLTYLGWNDPGSNRKYIVYEKDGKLTGMHGEFRPSAKKGACAICKGLDEIGMFMAETRHSGGVNYTKRGNYICVDSEKCNDRLDDPDRLGQFIDTLKK
ncbi:FusB/FusC family EF-G-binding protein [Bhargavaea cecembensis]|uniref:FusB/FusC family EF-G-binding protein n=1 Tax=Bhargavaea cecembensis TaxID=394098 RepID=UPI00058C3745|nr:elongation factor G-binding protein [Bhargavaea cecembensis]